MTSLMLVPLAVLEELKQTDRIVLYILDKACLGVCTIKHYIKIPSLRKKNQNKTLNLTNCKTKFRENVLFENNSAKWTPARIWRTTLGKAKPLLSPWR